MGNERKREPLKTQALPRTGRGLSRELCRAAAGEYRTPGVTKTKDYGTAIDPAEVFRDAYQERFRDAAGSFRELFYSAADRSWDRMIEEWRKTRTGALMP
jgi:hypothetical protein